MLVAFGYSLVATVFPGLFPAEFTGDPGATGAGVVDVYYESAAVIVALVLLGQVLELRARTAGGRVRGLGCHGLGTPNPCRAAFGG